MRWFAVWKTMRAKRLDGIDLTEADRLVTGRCPDPQPYGLGLLLDAARAPASAEELAGEQQAVARLVAARRAAVTASPVRRRDAEVPPPPRKTILALATGLALLVIAGVAAETGSLPTPLQQRAHDMFSLFGVPAPATDRRPDGGPSASAAPTPTTPTTPTASGTPDPDGAQVRGLCQAWNAAGRDPDGQAMNSQSWRALVATAGGKARVPALCTPLLDSPSPAAGGSTGAVSRSGAGPATPGHPTGSRRHGRSEPGPAR